MTESPPEEGESKPPMTKSQKTSEDPSRLDREIETSDAAVEGVDPITGEFKDQDRGAAILPHEIPSLPDELKEKPQPMSPETARALAEAGYQLSLAGETETRGSNGQSPAATGPVHEPLVRPETLLPPSASPSEVISPTPAPPAQPPPVTLPGHMAEENHDDDEALPGDEALPSAHEAPELDPTSADDEGEVTESTDDGGPIEEAPPTSPEPLGRASLLRVLLARETLPHFGILALLMIIFLALSFSDNETHGEWLMTLSLGGLGAYTVMGVVALTPLVDHLRNPRFGWIVPLALTLILAVALRQILLVDSTTADDNRDLLALALVGLFVLWQFMQAWWMRVPFENWALKRFAPSDDHMESVDGAGEEADWGGPVGAIDRLTTRMAGKGPLLNAIAPIVWAVAGLGLFELLFRLDIFQPEAGAFFEEYDNLFRVTWLGTMTVMGLLLMLVVRRMLRWAPDSGRVALFSGAFAFGFWVFLAYHAFALFWSLAQEPSFAFDLLFMLITILVAIYSLSSRAISTAGGLIRPENVLFFGIAFGISYSGASFFLISDFGGGFDPREVGYLSHLIAGLFGALVLLLANAGFMNLERHLGHGGLRGLRQGLGTVPASLASSGGNSADAEPETDERDRGIEMGVERQMDETENPEAGDELANPDDEVEDESADREEGPSVHDGTDEEDIQHPLYPQNNLVG